jgi:hypothetical protein
MTVVTMNRTRLIQIRLEVQSNSFLAADHGGDRVRATLIKGAATGIVRTPITPATLCKGWLMSKTDAMAPPIPEMMSKIKPVRPDLLCTRGQTAKPKAQIAQCTRSEHQ